ncbi:MAG: ribonuclease j1, ribonuclease [Candidatus Parcubacteria bacterium]|jgi:ribonuclease J
MNTHIPTGATPPQHNPKKEDTSKPSWTPAKPRVPKAHTPYTPSTTAPKQFQKKQSGGQRNKGFGNRSGGKSSKSYTQPESRYITSNAKMDVVPPLGDNIRIIPLGGVEEVGRNMTLIEYKDSIIVVDIGFSFQDADYPGIEYVLPNTRYLEDRKEKIKAVVITHAHLDHIGGIPYIMPRIGNPPIYSRLLTTVLIKRRQDEFPHLPPLDITVVEKESTITLGDITLKFFAVTHTIPDAMGVIIRTPQGSIVMTGDLKLEHENGVPVETENKEFAKFEKENVLLLMADSTNVERPGWSITESQVEKNIAEIIANTKGRLVIGMFASLVERIMAIINIAERTNKKIVVEGRSLKTNVEIVKQLRMLEPKPGTIITVEEMGNYPPDRIIILSTGAQANDYSALVRMSTNTHKYIKLNPTDTILFSASVIPGNERSIQKLKDNISRQGARIITYQTSDVHSSGHANREETAWIHRKVNAKFFVPVHGYHYMLRVHTEIAQSLGMPKENTIIPDNGAIIEIQEGGTKIVRLKENAPGAPIMVDGNSVGDIQEVVIRDRKLLAEDGMFVVIAVLDSKTGKLRKSPDLISRGFVYLKESQELLRQARILIKKTIEDSTVGMNPVDTEEAKGNVTEVLTKFLLQKTQKSPVIIPVILDF